jgi:hypothetical protein
MKNAPNPGSKKLAKTRRISSTTIIVTAVASCLLAVCAFAAPNIQREAAPVVDGSGGGWARRDRDSNVIPVEAPVSNVAIAAKTIKAKAKIAKSDYTVEPYNALKVKHLPDGKAWVEPDTNRLVGAVAKRDISARTVITSKDADLK